MGHNHRAALRNITYFKRKASGSLSLSKDSAKADPKTASLRRWPQANLSKEIADYLNKMGARIPNIKPGNATIEYLTKIQASKRFWGGVLLSTLATTSSILDHYLRNINTGFSIGLTSILIIELWQILQASVLGQKRDTLFCFLFFGSFVCVGGGYWLMGCSFIFYIKKAPMALILNFLVFGVIFVSRWDLNPSSLHQCV